MGNISGCYKDSDKNVCKTTSSTTTDTGNDCKALTPPARAEESQPDESNSTMCNKSPKISSSYTSTVSSDATTRRNYGNYRYHNSDYNYNHRSLLCAPGTGMNGSIGGGFGGVMGGGGFGGGMGGGGFGGGGGCGGGC